MKPITGGKKGKNPLLLYVSVFMSEYKLLMYSKYTCLQKYDNQCKMVLIKDVYKELTVSKPFKVPEWELFC